MPLISRFEHCRFCGGSGCAACPEEARKFAEAGGKHPEPRPAPSVGDCYVCGEPARFLCDGPPFDDGNPNGEQCKTCSKPMCDEHIAYHANIRLQKWAKGRGRYCEYNSIDYCKECHDRQNAEVDRLGAKPIDQPLGMRLFEAREMNAAIQWTNRGGQSLHLHSFIADRVKAPRVFVQAIDNGEQIAHLFDRDANRLEETARRLGVKVIKVEREGTSRQHIDLCGAPLRKAIAECVKE